MTKTPAKTNKKTALRIEKFCRAYVIDFNGAKAAETAGYSKHTARHQAQRLLTKDHVQARIAELTKKQVDKLEITAERVLQELAKLAFLDARTFFDEKGEPKRIVDLDDATAAALAGFEISGDGTKKFKLADKGINLERLGRHLKLFTDQIALSGLEGLAETIQEARKRAGTKE